ncbi:nucleotidyltransferase domain-containing protein [Candidatus Margulisiibacteriota bacterium]
MKFDFSVQDIIHSEKKMEVINFLLANEAKMSEREIASVVKVSHMTVNRIMQDLSEINFVNFITVGKAHLWQINKKSFSYQVFIKLNKEIKNIDFSQHLKENIVKTLLMKNISKITLFGSIVSGSNEPDSDIDLFILVKNSRDKAKLEKYIDRLSIICLEEYGNRLSPYVISERELKQKEGLAIIKEVSKGMQLYP